MGRFIILETMKAKEKAKELVELFKKTNRFVNTEICKQYALICQQEKIDMIVEFQESEHSDAFWAIENKLLELKEVKTEIEKL
jgi:hypothetical protein